MRRLSAANPSFRRKKPPPPRPPPQERPLLSAENREVDGLICSTLFYYAPNRKKRRPPLVERGGRRKRLSWRGAARNEQATGREHATIECCEPFFQEKEAPASRPTPRKPLLSAENREVDGLICSPFFYYAPNRNERHPPLVERGGRRKRLSWRGSRAPEVSAASGRFSEPEVRHETSRRPAGSMRRLSAANLLSPERRCPLASHSFTATASISNRPPLGSLETSTQLRAGLLAPKAAA